MSSDWIFGFSEHPGSRYKGKQEDRGLIDLDTRLVAVFDGHMGTKASQFCKENCVNMFQEDLPQNPPTTDQVVQKFIETFEGLDRRFRKEFLNVPDGTTAVAAHLSSRNEGDDADTVVLASSGDSMAIVCQIFLLDREQAGPGFKILGESRVHKPTDEDERQRIIDSGGWVTNDHRLGGIVLTSRNIGSSLIKDSEAPSARINPAALEEPLRKKNPVYFKDISQGLIATPDVRKIKLPKNKPQSEDDHDDDDNNNNNSLIGVIVASDGLWDAASSEQAAEIMRNKIIENKNAQSPLSYQQLAERISAELIRFARARGSTDNCFVIVGFKQQ